MSENGSTNESITDMQNASMNRGWSIKSKLISLTIFTIFGILLCYVIGYFAFKAVLANDDKYGSIILCKDLIADVLPPPEYIIETYLVSLQLSEANEPAEIDKLFKECERLKSEYDDRHKYWIANLPEGEIKKILLEDSFNPAIKFYKILNEEFLPLIKVGKKAEAKVLTNGILKTLYAEHRLAIDQVVTKTNAQNTLVAQSAVSVVSNQISLLVIVGLITIFILTIGSVLIAKSILKHLGEITKGIEEGLGKGNLSIRLKGSTNTEIGRMANILNKTSDSVKSAVSEINKGSVSLDSAASSLASTSSSMSGNLQDASKSLKNVNATSIELSSNINAVASSMEEMTASIKEIAHSVHSAGSLTSQAQSNAEEVGAAIQGLVKNSLEISYIVNTINALAQQTNLLALNATIEAARAGESGKGFAVVAQEVKDLAFKTAIATESIGKQVESIQTNIKSTTEKVGAIVSMVSQINDSQNLIASAIEEQTATTNEIAHNISNVSHQGNEMTSNLNSINNKVQDSVSQASKVDGESKSLKKISGQLQVQVNAFSL